MNDTVYGRSDSGLALSEARIAYVKSLLDGMRETKDVMRIELLFQRTKPRVVGAVVERLPCGEDKSQ